MSTKHLQGSYAPTRHSWELTWSSTKRGVDLRLPQWRGRACMGASKVRGWRSTPGLETKLNATDLGSPLQCGTHFVSNQVLQNCYYVLAIQATLCFPPVYMCERKLSFAWLGFTWWYRMANCSVRTHVTHASAGRNIHIQQNHTQLIATNERSTKTYFHITKNDARPQSGGLYIHIYICTYTYRYMYIDTYAHTYNMQIHYKCIQCIYTYTTISIL